MTRVPSVSWTPFTAWTRVYSLERKKAAYPQKRLPRSRFPHNRSQGNMTKYLTLIFKNLLRSKRRNILTILSIAVSLFIFSVLVSLPTFANQMLADTTSSVRIICRTKMGLAYPLPVAYKPKIAAIPHVVAVAPLVIYGGIYHEVSDQFPSVATEAAQIDMW